VEEGGTFWKHNHFIANKPTNIGSDIFQRSVPFKMHILATFVGFFEVNLYNSLQEYFFLNLAQIIVGLKEWDWMSKNCWAKRMGLDVKYFVGDF